MSKALYRTYRSKSFDEIVGQSHVTDLLKNAIASDKIAHAYLLTGPRGVGKTSVARIIAHAVNGLEYSEDPHLDIIEIDAASNRRIDDIRDLRDKVHIAPVSARFKVYIIDEVHMLTGESFNALLKTLEEPPEHVIFILATTEVHKLPATIISRTQRFHFRPATTSDITTHLQSIADKEEIAYDPEAIAALAVHAGGSFRDSLSLLDQLSGLSEKITTELVESVLGMAEQRRVEAIIEAIERGDVATLVTELDAIQSAGVSATILTEQLSRAIAVRARKKHELYQILDALTDVPKAHDPDLKLIATLVRFTQQPQPQPQPQKNVALHTTSAPTVAAKPAALRSQAVAREQAKQAEPAVDAVAMPEPTVVEAAPPNDHSTDATPQTPPVNGVFDWDAVLAAIKKHHAPLYSVMSRAGASYDEAANILSLNFEYAIHRKKMENQASRKQFGALMNNLFGLNPELKITDQKSTAALDTDAQAIAAIMGGGEPVSGTI